MLRKLLPDTYHLSPLEVESEIFQSLKHIELQLQGELAAKQKAVEAGWQEIQTLRSQLEAKDQAIQTLQARLVDNQRNIEGNRQLINKLLGDLDRMRQDLEWYKRTYENRSMLGVIKDKIKYFFR